MLTFVQTPNPSGQAGPAPVRAKKLSKTSPSLATSGLARRTRAPSPIPSLSWASEVSESQAPSLSPYVWFAKGNLLDGVNRHEEALEAFAHATRLKPDYAEAWSNKGNILAKLGRHVEAHDAHSRAIELQPRDAVLWFNSASGCILAGERKDALKSLSRAIQLDPKFKKNAKEDEDFKSLWDDEEFKKIVS